MGTLDRKLTETQLQGDVNYSRFLADAQAASALQDAQGKTDDQR